jgi:hypothetical protein
MQQPNNVGVPEKIHIVLGFAVLPERYVGIEESLIRLNVELNQLLADSPWFCKRGLNSLTIAFSIVQEEAPPSLGRNYIGHDHSNPRIIVELDDQLFMRSKDVRSTYLYFLSGCVRGIEYAFKKLKLPNISLDGLEKLKNAA